MGSPPPRKATWRMGARERYRLQWLAVAIILLLLYFALRPYYDSLVQRRLFVTCQDNVKKIAQGFSNYMNDWDETTPPADHWMDSVEGNMGVTSGTGYSMDRYFHCPSDKSSAASSYAYNDVMAGLSQAIKNVNDTTTDALLRAIGHFDRAPLVIEKHGSARNAHLSLRNWDDVGREMTLPHPLPDLTGSLVFGDRNPGLRTQEQLQTLAGRTF